MPLDIVGIDLGHDQRHLGIHTESMAVIDHDGAALDGLGQQLLGDIVAGSASTMSQPSKASGQASSITICSPRNSTVLPAERALASSWSLPTGNFCSLRHSEHLGATAPRRAQNSNRVLFHASPFRGCGFCPHAEQTGIVASVCKNRAGTKPAPSGKRKPRSKRPAVDFLRQVPKIYWDNSYLWSAARGGIDRRRSLPGRRPSQYRSRRRGAVNGRIARVEVLLPRHR